MVQKLNTRQRHRRETAPNKATSESRVFAASTAYNSVKSISKRVFIIIYMTELISEVYKTWK